jgi:hypothetical protein
MKKLFSFVFAFVVAVFSAQGHAQSSPQISEEVIKASAEFIVIQLEHGDKHPKTLAAMENLAKIFSKNNMNLEAFNALQNALQIRIETQGPNHPDVASTHDIIANEYMIREAFNKAQDHYIKAANIRKKAFGANHLEYAKSMENLYTLHLANLFLGTGHGSVNDALNYINEYARIIASAKGKNTIDYANALTKRSTIYSLMAKYSEAANDNAQSIAIKESIFGQGYDGVGPDYYTLKTQLSLAGRKQEEAKIENKIKELEAAGLIKPDPNFAKGIKDLIDAAKDYYQNKYQGK